MGAPENDEPERDPRTGLYKGEKSYGGRVDEHHWTHGRDERNKEALEYYRERSKAPGVAEGGGARNFYCMQCDGVIAHDHAGESCPHCGASIAGEARRYFNWVEIDRPPSGDARALLVPVGLALVLLAAVAALAWWWLA